jgi:two-component system response regulator ResD
MLQLILSEEDFEVRTAATVDSAIEMATSGNFDLYVLDKRLPDGSGLELCATLNRISPGVPCIFYTGDAYEVHRQQAIAAGATAFVPKPDVDGLIDMVHKLLSESECAPTT